MVVVLFIIFIVILVACLFGSSIKHNDVAKNEEIVRNKSDIELGDDFTLNGYDDLFVPVAKFICETQQSNISIIQRNFRIGFNRAARIIDQLYDAGIVGPELGTRPREILISAEELDDIIYKLSTEKPYDVIEVKDTSFDENITDIETIVITQYHFPPINLLIDQDQSDEFSKDFIVENSRKIQKHFSQHDYLVNVAHVSFTRTYATFKVEYPKDLIISKSVLNQIAEALTFSNGNRVDIVIGDVINTLNVRLYSNHKSVLRIKNLLQKGSEMSVILGIDEHHNIQIFDYENESHLLIGGNSDIGKSNLLDSIIISILYKFTPFEARIILIDTGIVQFGAYNGIPNLLLPVETEYNRIASTLNWINKEITDRLEIFSTNDARNFTHYLGLCEKIKNLKPLPRLFVIINDVCDVLLNLNEAEEELRELVINARVTGIHLIMVTTKPTVKSVGSIAKANLTSRISFKTASAMDSYTILGVHSDEKQLEEGQALYKKLETNSLVKFDVPTIEMEEINRVVDYLKSQM